MGINKAAALLSLILLTACQSPPQAITGPPQTRPSGQPSSATPHSPFATSLSTPQFLPLPDRTPAAMPEPLPSNHGLPAPDFHPPLTCPGCGYKLTSPAQATWSPDGQQLAYVVNEIHMHCPVSPARAEQNIPFGSTEPAFDYSQLLCGIRTNQQAFVKRGQAPPSLALAPPKVAVKLGGWSPQGDHLLLQVLNTETHNNSQIYTVTSDGSELSRVYPTETQQQLPSWSADGKQIAFVDSEQGHSTPWIETVNRDGSGWQRLASMGDFPRQLLWHQDRVAIAETWSAPEPGAPTGSRLRIVSPTGEETILPLSELEDQTLTNFRWSPDGKWLAYASRMYSGQQAYLRLAAPDGTMSRTLQSMYPRGSDGGFSGLAWSPDGRFLAYAQTQVTAEGVDVSDLYLFEPETNQTTALTQAAKTGKPVIYRNPVWSPDGQRLAFLSNHEVKFREVYRAADSLYTMKRDGTDIQIEVRGTYSEFTSASPVY